MVVPFLLLFDLLFDRVLTLGATTPAREELSVHR